MEMTCVRSGDRNHQKIWDLQAGWKRTNLLRWVNTASVYVRSLRESDCPYSGSAIRLFSVARVRRGFRPRLLRGELA